MPLYRDFTLSPGTRPVRARWPAEIHLPRKDCLQGPTTREASLTIRHLPPNLQRTISMRSQAKIQARDVRTRKGNGFRGCEQPRGLRFEA
jgi:hypothetical protein